MMNTNNCWNFYLMNNYVIIIDTCALMSFDFTNKLLSDLKEACKEYNQKVQIPSKVREELRNHLHSDSPDKRGKANYAWNLIDQLDREGRVGYIPDDSSHADAVILSFVTRKRTQSNILVVTCDTKLTKDCLNLRESESSLSKYKLYVKKVHNGHLVDGCGSKYQSGNAQTSYPNRQGGNAQASYPNRQGGNAQASYPNRQGGNAQTSYPNRQGGNAQASYPNRQSGNAQASYPNRQSGNAQTSYPNCQSGNTNFVPRYTYTYHADNFNITMTLKNARGAYNKGFRETPYYEFGLFIESPERITVKDAYIDGPYGNVPVSVKVNDPNYRISVKRADIKGSQLKVTVKGSYKVGMFSSKEFTFFVYKSI